MSHPVTLVTLVRVEMTARTADGSHLGTLYADLPLGLPVHTMDSLELGMLNILKARIPDLVYVDTTHDEIAWAEL